MMPAKNCPELPAEPKIIKIIQDAPDGEVAHAEALPGGRGLGSESLAGDRSKHAWVAANHKKILGLTPSFVVRPRRRDLGLNYTDMTPEEAARRVRAAL